MADDPFTLFETWFAEARESEPNDPNAMVSPRRIRVGGRRRGWCC